MLHWGNRKGVGFRPTKLKSSMHGLDISGGLEKTCLACGGIHRDASMPSLRQWVHAILQGLGKHAQKRYQ